MAEQLALFTVVIISFSVSLFIYFKNPKSATNLLFSFFAASLVFWSIVMHFSIYPPLPVQMLFFVRLSMLAAIIMSYAALLLSYTIPSHVFKLSPKRLFVISTFVIVGRSSC